MAGTGKSTIAQTITRTLTEQDRLAANVSLPRGRGNLQPYRYTLQYCCDPIGGYFTDFIDAEILHMRSNRPTWQYHPAIYTRPVDKVGLSTPPETTRQSTIASDLGICS